MSPSTLTYTDVYLALDGGFVERRVVPVISGVGVGPLTQQQGHHLQTPEDKHSSPHSGFKVLDSHLQASITGGVMQRLSGRIQFGWRSLIKMLIGVSSQPSPDRMLSQRALKASEREHRRDSERSGSLSVIFKAAY